MFKKYFLPFKIILKQRQAGIIVIIMNVSNILLALLNFIGILLCNKFSGVESFIMLSILLVLSQGFIKIIRFYI